MKVYLAGPDGFTESGRFFFYGKIIPIFEKNNFEVLNPWVLTPQADEVAKIADFYERKKSWEQLDPIIGYNNERAIKECDLVYANLDGTDVDSGTASEIGFASALGKMIIGYRSDFRSCSDNEGVKVNLQVEYFLKRNKGAIISSINDLEKILKLIENKF